MKRAYYLYLISIIFLTACGENKHPNDTIPRHYILEIQSKHLAEKRVINIWTPPAYEQLTDSLPVMYMLDGGISEDFPHIANTFAALIAQKSIPPMILVGIENTERRRDLTGFTEVFEDKKVASAVGGSPKFSAFLQDELFPEINKRYRSTTQKGIMGESIAGLFVIETFLQKPDMFDYYIAFDPSLWWNDHYLVKTAKKQLATFPNTPKKLWLTASNTEEIAPFVKQLVEILSTENIPSLKWTFQDEPKENHNSIFRATKEKALIWTLAE